MGVKIVTDSAADIPQDLAKKLGITIVPLRVNFGRDSFMDGVDIDQARFLQLCNQENPSTAPAPPHVFQEILTPLVDEGHQVLVLTLSSALSGTFHSAKIAAGNFGGSVKVIDSLSVSAGQAVLAIRAAQADAKDLAALEDFVEEQKKKIKVFGLLEEVDPIIRGGRLGVFAQAAHRGNVKLVFTPNEKGAVQILERVRGRNRGLDLMAENLTEATGDLAVISHVNSPGDANSLAYQVKRRCGFADVLVGEASCTVGTYAGRGAIIVAG